jgi:hypothetical protein
VTRSDRPLEPRDAAASPFHDSLVGLAAVVRGLDVLLAGPEVSPDESSPSNGMHDWPGIDVLLGLLSLRKTLDAGLDVLLMSSPNGAAAQASPAHWDRGILR